MKLILSLILINFIFNQIVVNCLFELGSSKNVIGYYSNNFKNKALKYHSLGEFCSSGSYDAVIIGSLYWSQNLTQFYFDCTDYQSIIQDKERASGITSKPPLRVIDFSKKGMKKNKEEELQDEETEHDVTKKPIQIEKNTYLTNKCGDLRADILKCQSLDIKVLIQVGGTKGVGEFANTSLASKLHAQKLAVKIWDMFLFGDNGRKVYADKLKKGKDVDDSTSGSEEIASFGSEDSLDDIDKFSDEPKKEESSSDSMLYEEDDQNDDEEYQDEYSNDEETSPHVLDSSNDGEYVDEEDYSLDPKAKAAKAAKLKSKLATKKPIDRKKKIPIFTPRPFGYDLFLDGVDLSPIVGKSDNYYHLAMGLDNYRVPRKDLFLLSATVDSSILNSKKEMLTASNSTLLRFNFDFLTLDFIHNKQSDYNSKGADQLLIDWAKYTVEYKFNQTRLFLLASTNTKDTTYFTPTKFLDQFVEYSIGFPNMAGVAVSDCLSASKIINSTNHLDFPTEIANGLKDMDSSRIVRKVGRPIYTPPKVTKPPVTKAPATKVPPITKAPITKAPIVTKAPITKAPIVTKKPVITKLTVTKKPIETPVPTKLSKTHKPLTTQSPAVLTESSDDSIYLIPATMASEEPTIEIIGSSEAPPPVITKTHPPITKKPTPTKLPPTHKPIIVTEEPIIETEEPIIETKAPVEPESDEPFIIKTHSPRITKAPIVITKSPTHAPTITKKPTPTKLPPTHKPIETEIVIETEAPIIVTETPIIKTKVPIVETEAPVVATKEPKLTIISNEPVYLFPPKKQTQAPIVITEPPKVIEEPEIEVQHPTVEEPEIEIINPTVKEPEIEVQHPTIEEPGTQEQQPTIVEQESPAEVVEQPGIQEQDQTFEQPTTVEQESPVVEEETGGRRHKPISATEFDKNFLNK